MLRIESIRDGSLELDSSIIENIPPKGVSFSDFLATFAMPFVIYSIFGFATLKQIKNPTWQNLNQFLVAQ